ncbi:MAG TPA: carboxypeptidase-like regulatory domain-containing protein [Acidimicrobiales bacterium]|nr:carboxypeptidase-like regulatory domain-containing protein [Acidimicrobiales bacterium]
MRRALWSGVAVVALAGCGGGVPSIDLPTPPTTRAGRVATTLPDTSGVALAGIPGVTTVPPPALAPGNSRITGTVRGPDGPIGGATVRIERFVGDASARADIITRPDGTFATDPILGGRYRVRAWRAPDLAIDRPVVFYLDDAKTQPVDLGLTAHGGIDVGASISPDPPYEDALGVLAVSVTGVSVDGNGIVRTAPVAGIAVDLTVPSGWQVFTADPQATSDSGRATYQVRCTLAGSGGFFATVGGQTFTLDVPSCTTPPPTTTTTEPETSTTVGVFTTTTRSSRGNGNGRPGSP